MNVLTVIEEPILLRFNDGKLYDNDLSNLEESIVVLKLSNAQNVENEEAKQDTQGSNKLLLGTSQTNGSSVKSKAQANKV